MPKVTRQPDKRLKSASSSAASSSSETDGTNDFIMHRGIKYYPGKNIKATHDFTFEKIFEPEKYEDKRYNQHNINVKYMRGLLNAAITDCRNDERTELSWNQQYLWLGCGKEEFKKHIESQFQPGNIESYWKADMTWDNYGTWALDHMMPVNAFDHTEDLDVKKCWHYTNLKPEWYWFNLWKGDRILYDMHWNGNRWIFYGRNGLWNWGGTWGTYYGPSDIPVPKSYIS